MSLLLSLWVFCLDLQVLKLYHGANLLTFFVCFFFGSKSRLNNKDSQECNWRGDQRWRGYTLHLTPLLYCDKALSLLQREHLALNNVFIYPSFCFVLISSTYLGHRSNSLSREIHMLFSQATSTNSSGGATKMFPSQLRDIISLGRA